MKARLFIVLVSAGVLVYFLAVEPLNQWDKEIDSRMAEIHSLQRVDRDRAEALLNLPAVATTSSDFVSSIRQTSIRARKCARLYGEVLELYRNKPILPLSGGDRADIEKIKKALASEEALYRDATDESPTQSASAATPVPFRWQMPRGVTADGMATVRGVVQGVQDDGLVIACEEPQAPVSSAIRLPANAGAGDIAAAANWARKAAEQGYGPPQVMFQGALKSTAVFPVNYAHGTVLLVGLPDRMRFSAGARVKIVAAALPNATSQGGRPLRAYSAVFALAPEAQRSWTEEERRQNAYVSPLNQPARR